MASSTVALVLLAVQFACFIINAGNGLIIQKFPAILIFGDSTVDTGNNNYISTSFKANHRPYGVDFPGNISTGRFSNGKLVPDMLASKLVIKETVPPFLEPHVSDTELVTGVSFASAGSGYDELTAAVTHAIPMTKQLSLFKKYFQRLKKIVGEKEAQRIVANALVMVSAATNDFIFNYYDIPTRRLEFNITQYQSFLLNKLENFVKDLYGLGCRMIVVSGLPPLGCLPIQMAAKSPIPRSCIDEENSDAETYNNRLEKLLLRIQQHHPGSEIHYADMYTIVMDMINNPEKYGFVEVGKGCCGTGQKEAGPFCNELSPVCENHSQYLFWDSIHPGEATYQYISQYLEKQLLSKLSHYSSW